jgi:hypothetical protein
MDQRERHRLLALGQIPTRKVGRLLAPKRKSLAHINKTWMGCSGSNNLAGDSDCLAMEMPTPPKRSYSARVASCFETET